MTRYSQQDDLSSASLLESTDLSTMRAGQRIRTLGLTAEGDGGEGDLVKVSHSTGTDSIWGVNIDGLQVFQTSDGSVLVREGLLRNNVIEPRHFDHVFRSRVNGQATQTQREANWNAIRSAIEWPDLFVSNEVPVTVHLPKGKIEIDVDQPACVAKAHGGAEGMRIVGGGGSAGGTWLQDRGGPATHLFEINSTNNVSIQRFRCTTFQGAVREAVIVQKAGDYYDVDGVTVIGPVLDKSVGCDFQGLVLQAAADAGPSVAGIWLYGAGQSAVVACQIGNSNTYPVGIKLGASSLPGRPARQQLPRGIVDSVLVAGCSMYQSAIEVEKCSGLTITRCEMITGAGIDSRVLLTEKGDVRNLHIHQTQFWGNGGNEFITELGDGPDRFEGLETSGIRNDS